MDDAEVAVFLRAAIKFLYWFWGTRVGDLLDADLTGKSSDDIPSQSYGKRARV